MAQYWLKRTESSVPEGPFGADEMKQRAAVGDIMKESFVSEDNTNWTLASKVKGLFSSQPLIHQTESATRPLPSRVAKHGGTSGYAVPEQTNMCPHCGGETVGSTLYCKCCGRRKTRFKSCASCCEPIAKEAKQCSYCGEKVPTQKDIQGASLSLQIRATKLGAFLSGVSITSLFLPPIISIREGRIRLTKWSLLGLRTHHQEIQVGRVASVRYTKGVFWGGLMIETFGGAAEDLNEKGLLQRDAKDFADQLKGVLTDNI